MLRQLLLACLQWSGMCGTRVHSRAELVVRFQTQPTGAQRPRGGQRDHQPVLLTGWQHAALPQHGGHAEAVGPAQVGVAVCSCISI